MNAALVLKEATDHGVQLWVDNGELRVRAPQGALHSELRERIRAAKSGLIEYIGPQRKFGPVSSAQRRLWFLNRLQPADAAYHMPLVLRITGPLDPGMLETALVQIVERHETLRTTFGDLDGEPVQIVHPVGFFKFNSLSRKIETDPEEIESIALAELLHPFNLESEPPMRARLVRFSHSDHLLVIVLHHIVFDGVSMNVLVRDLAAAYETAPMPPLELTYLDYTARECIHRGAPDFAESLRWWTQRLQGIEPVDLPAARPRPGDRLDGGVTLEVQLAPELVDALESLGKSADATLFTAMLTAFQALIVRYTNQRDFAVVCPMVNRSQPGSEHLIGPFVNLVPIRNQIDPEMNFAESLSRVRAAVLDALERQDSPFEMIVEELAQSRDAARHPIAQILFALQNPPPTSVSLGDAAATRLDLARTTVRFDLELHVRREGRRFSCAWIYSTELFDRLFIERMAIHYVNLLQSITVDPRMPFRNLRILTETELEVIMAHAKVPVDHAVPAYPGPIGPIRPIGPLSGCATLCRVFEARALERRDAPGLSFEGCSLSYSELNARANRLARRLVSLGVGPEVLVALHLERSFDVVIAILAVLKAGGAYVPLDPEYPAERLRLILEDARCPVLISESTCAGKLPRLPEGTAVLLLDHAANELESLDAGDLDVPVSPEHAAYVIYTSGSTGAPKGCVLTHHNVLRLFTSTDAWFTFTAEDVWTLFHSYAFDFSVWELWGALLYGGRLVIVPGLVARSPESFHALLVDEGVTVLNQTPSAFRALMEYEGGLRRPAAGRLRYIIFGGENLTVQDLGPWFARHGDQRPQLINMYGITETTVHVTYRALRAEDARGRVGSPIGVAIADLALYVLDPHRRLVPMGVPGELYVGGPGLARGYLNRPELSAERFIESAVIEGVPCGRLYRSGDLVRWTGVGSGAPFELEYLGRVDAQVKIRGYRVELGEIESVLRGHPGVREAGVSVLETPGAGRRLAAYVVRNGHGAATAATLRTYLRERLPEYMVPAFYETVERLPLMPSGKLDRSALRRPSVGARKGDESDSAPRSEIERACAALWRDVLDVPRVGLYDNFFDLGGHSLLATQLLSRVRAQFRKDVPLREFFEHPTVAGLAEVLQNGGDTSVGTIRTTSRNLDEQLATLEDGPE